MQQHISDKLEMHFEKYEVRSYPKGRTLIHAGEDPQGVLLLMDGIIEQYDITPEGNKVVVNIFKPPAFFPMSWAINKTANTYFYSTVTDVRCKLAGTDETVASLRSEPDAMFDLLGRVYKGTDALLRRLVLMASGIAASRLIFELLIEAYRFGKEIDGRTRFITIRQNALAARSGLARETVNRELQKLEREAIISRTKQGIIIDTRKIEDKLDLSA